MLEKNQDSEIGLTIQAKALLEEILLWNELLDLILPISASQLSFWILKYNQKDYNAANCKRLVDLLAL